MISLSTLIVEYEQDLFEAHGVTSQRILEGLCHAQLGKSA